MKLRRSQTLVMSWLRAMIAPLAKPILAVLALPLVVGCLASGAGSAELHRWWSGLGPVLPHDTFPADCSLCHEGANWNQLRADFQFDHEKRTGVRLEGAHAQAQCLRCHNDRGPIATFTAKGCVGCHEDFHQGELGKDCTSCHSQDSWRLDNQVERHARTRFPLVGAHAGVACQRCHEGAYVGRFRNADNKCSTCHQDDLQRATNPPHIGLGWVRDCQRCHQPTSWNHAIFR